MNLNNNLMDFELEQDIEEYTYIYKVELKQGGDPKYFYFLEAQNTHWAFDCYLSSVKYIRVKKSSIKYKSAYYNSKTHNIIEINDNKDNSPLNNY